MFALKPKSKKSNEDPDQFVKWMCLIVCHGFRVWSMCKFSKESCITDQNIFTELPEFMFKLEPSGKKAKTLL